MDNQNSNRYSSGCWQQQGRRGGRGGSRGRQNGFDRNRNFRNQENKGNHQGGFSNHNGWKRNDNSNYHSHNKNHFQQQTEKKNDFFENLTIDDIYSSLNGSKHSWYDIGRVKIIPKANVGQFKSSGFLH